MAGIKQQNQANNSWIGFLLSGSNIDFILIIFNSNL